MILASSKCYNMYVFVSADMYFIHFQCILILLVLHQEDHIALFLGDFLGAQGLPYPREVKNG